MECGAAHCQINGVALRKESVDRKGVVVGAGQQRGVALRKESVDRKLFATPTVLVITGGRSPQGERG